MNAIITPFAYSDLPAPVAAEVRDATTRIKDHLTRQVKDIIETGRDLLEVKTKLQHGQFERWLDSEFGMAVRTAQRFMRASEWAQDKNDIVSHLTPTTVYMLSAKSTPEGVHEQVVERLERGLPAESEYVHHVIQEARIKKGQAEQKARASERRRNKKQDQDQQLDAVSEAEEHADKTQSAHIGGVNYDALCRAWNACNEDEQGRFLINIGWDSKS